MHHGTKAGSQKGFSGKHSSLFREVMRLAKLLPIKEIFLENVSSLTSAHPSFVKGKSQHLINLPREVLW
jgi:site-specific DNA-cytosine methylase